MNDLRTAAQQALEALELAQTDVHWELNSPTRKFLRKAEKNLRAALTEPVEPVPQPGVWMHPWPPVRAQQAEPVQEPVGYLPAYELDRLQSGHDGRLRSAKFGASVLDGDVAVYTAPGSAPPQPAQPEPEPVAWMESPHGAIRANPLYKHVFPSQLLHWQVPLYTAPPQRKPLTKEEIMRAFYAAEKTPMSIRHGLSVVESARIVERAHGIGEQP